VPAIASYGVILSPPPDLRRPIVDGAPTCRDSEIPASEYFSHRKTARIRLAAARRDAGV